MFWRSWYVTAAAAGCVLSMAVPLLPAAEKHTDKQIGEAVDNAALVYFVREKKMQWKARTFFVFADDEFVGTIDNNCYTFAYLRPGERLLWLNFAKITETAELQPGEVYYYKVTPTGTSFSNRLSIEDIGEDWGQALVAEVKSYCTPTEKEIETSEKYVVERLGKAQKYAAKEPEGSYWYSREKSVGRWPHADLAPYSTLIIEDFTLTDPKADERKHRLQVQTAPSRIADKVEGQLGDEVFAEVLRGEKSELAEGTVVLRGEITRYKPGSRVARSAMIGTSNSYLDFAMHLIDAATGEELATFSGDRTWFWGGMAGESVGIEEMEESLAFELAVYLTECKTGVEWQPE
jgi:hypothetical protein